MQVSGQKVHPSPKPTDSMTRKHSVVKQGGQGKHFSLELPRFYSQDEKKKKKTMLKKDSQRVLERDKGGKLKESKRAPKTQKTQTPTKNQQQSVKKIKVNKERWDEMIRKSANSSQHQQPPVIHSQRKTTKPEESTTIDQSQEGRASHPNKIRYKTGRKLSDGQKQAPSPSRIAELIQTETAMNQQATIRYKKDTNKIFTEQTVVMSKKEPSVRPKGPSQQAILKHLQKEVNSPERKQKQKHVRNNTSFEIHKRRLSKEETDLLHRIHEILKKTIRTPHVLEVPESYIVADKTKMQKKYYSYLEQHYKKAYRSHIIFTRLAYYLCAHNILISAPTKPLLPLFTKLQDSHTIVMSLLGIEASKDRVKYYSHQKASSRALDSHRVKEDHLIQVENRGNSLFRNNGFVKNMLEAIVSKKSFEHSQLFVSMMQSAEQIDSFDFINFLDKTLKWDVLKMPSYPFLPKKEPHFRHHLILDLDETLIHFDPDDQTFHIRPHAEQFVESMAAHYEVTVFTAATKEYADEILNEMDRKGSIRHRLYRNHLTFLEGESIKDLSMLGRDMKTTIIVDNLWSNFRLNMENGILIKSWFGGGGDNILPKLENFLIKLCKDFPQDLRKGLVHHKDFIDSEITERYRGIKIKYDI